MRENQLFRRLKATRVSRVSLVYALVLGAIPTLILMLALPLNQNKYEVDLVFKSIIESYWFEDLDADQKKEKLAYGVNPDSSLHLNVTDGEGAYIGQYNFKYSLAKTKSIIAPCSHDIDGDGLKEIIIFTQNRDSLFINVFDYSDLSISLENRFLTTIGGLNKKTDYNYHCLGWHDSNDDSIEELYLSVAAGFAIYPRRIFRYDFKQDSLLWSVNTGASYLIGDAFHSDKGFHLLVSSSASSNITDSYPFPYHDTCGWVLSFDEDLKLISDPIPLGEYPSQTEGIVNISNHAYCIYSANNTIHSRTLIIEVDREGLIVDSLIIPGQFVPNHSGLHSSDKIIYLFSRDDVGVSYAVGVQPLSLLPDRKARSLKSKRASFQEDLDMDGKPEAILLDRKTLCYKFYPDGQFKKGEVIAPINGKHKIISAKFDPSLHRGEIALSSYSDSEIYDYHLNQRYKYRFLIWLMVYCISVVFVFAVMYLQGRRIERRHMLEQQVANLQLQNLRNQLDPHFTFNALNSVGNAIYQENKEQAYDLFQRFTRMIRSSLMVSQQVFRPLVEEIQFTTDYLEFQKTRFRDRFDYSFEIDPGLDIQKNEIPKMLIQGFAENAVKHAFYKIDYKGQITISIQDEAESIRITIEDNGIGIRRSKELGATSGTQKGEQIIQNQINQINRLYKRRISYNIIDRYANQSKGTRIEILLAP